MKFFYRAIAISIVVWVAVTVARKARRSVSLTEGNERIDEMSLESFPSSDAPSSWAGTDE
jgi:hypothetical protein